MYLFIYVSIFALAVADAALFSLFIVYDVHMIAPRLSPDE